MNIHPQGCEEPVVRLGTPLEGISVAHHSGPGLRLIFWVQGCSLLCTRRCLNPHLLRSAGGYPVAASALTRRLLRLATDHREAEGVTVLGGEPFDQAAALAAALAPVRRAGLSLMVYTGHVAEELERGRDPGALELLALCDLLVDGPFVDALHDSSLVWRGSSNQRILRRGDRYSQDDLNDALARQGRALYVSRGPFTGVVVSGAQTPEVARRLRGLAQELVP